MAVFIGTSGFSYNHWIGNFYPEDLKEKEFLQYYSRYFNTVELNVTFYRLPQQGAFRGWYSRTTKKFVFAVKGNRFITHIKKLKRCRSALRLFFNRIKPLGTKIGPILWQLPPSYKKDIKVLGIFLSILSGYKKFRHVFEFRHESWFDRDVFNLLESMGIGLCSADWPSCSKGIHLTTDLIYIRRHGHGAKLYSGCYSMAQLRKDAEIIKTFAAEKKDVYIYFNNDAHGYAVKNAMQLKKILGM